MSNHNPPMSVAEVCELPDGAWVNNGFTAVARSVKSETAKKTGRKFWICLFADTTGSATIECSLFTVPKFSQGDTIEAFGSGIKFTNGQYGPKVTIGDKATIAVKVHSTSPAPRETAPAAEPRAAANGANGHATRAAAAAPTDQHAPVNGQTVGMAMKEALALIIRGVPTERVVGYISELEFWAAVHEVASDIIRTSLLLEKGKLALPVRVRSEPTAAAPAARQPAPARVAAPAPVEPEPAHAELEEDVPFN